MCALSSLDLFVEGKLAVQGSCLKQLWVSSPEDELSGEKYNNVFNEHIAEVVFFFHFKSPLYKWKALIANRSSGSVTRFSIYQFVYSQ